MATGSADEETAQLVKSGEVKHDPPFTSWQKTCLRVGLNLNMFCIYFANGLLAAFFPRYALGRGLSQTEVGFIFAMLPTFWFISAPLWSFMCAKTAPRYLITFGVAGTGVTLFAFGFLPYTGSATSFFIMALLLRAIQGLFSSAAVTSGYVLVANSFPKMMGEVIGVMEIFVGVGYALGAPVGGFLFEYGGFFMIFLVVSCFLAVLSVALFFVIPDEYYRNPATASNRQSMLSLLRDGRVVMDLFIGLFGMSVLAMLEPVAQIHITDYFPLITPVKVGLLFMLCVLCYAISAPLSGMTSDYIGRQPVIIFGLYTIAFGLYCFAPLGWPFSVTLTVIIVGLGLVGLGMGATMVPVVPDLVECAGNGNEENAAGLTGFFSLGEIIGPSVGSVVMEHYGFNAAAAAWTITALLLGTILLVVKVFNICVWPPSKYRQQQVQQKEQAEHDRKQRERMAEHDVKNTLTASSQSVSSSLPTPPPTSEVAQGDV